MRTRRATFLCFSLVLALAPVTVATSPAAHAADGRGSVAVGSASYPVPGAAVFVAPWGSDGGTGRSNAPFRTVQRAVNAAPAGGTVVIRGGTYHESVTMPYQRPLTVQAYPGEAVWFDGTRRVSGWVRDGSAWRVDNWDVNLDASPTFMRGLDDNTAQYWRFVSPEHPMAAHPDQLWINGSELKQVGSRGEVVPGTFFVDKGARRLYTGTDPVGRDVRATDLSRAFSLRANGTTLRGVGIRRFGPSVPDQGAVNSYQPGVTLENVVMEDSSTAGIGLYGANSRARNVTVKRSGQIGIIADKADNLTLDNVVVSGNNKEHFNTAPVAGGVKVTNSKNVTFANSLVADNDGNGFWVDESVYNVTAVNNVVRNNTRIGVYYELSERGVIENNTITGSGEFGIAIYNTGNVRVRNNTVLSRGEGLNIHQDRRTSPAGSTHPDMTWRVRNLDIQYNVLGADGPSAGTATAIVRIDALGMLDARAGSPQNLVLNNNRYAWTQVRPRFVWFYSISEDGRQFLEHTELPAMTRQLGQEAQGQTLGRIASP